MTARTCVDRPGGAVGAAPGRVRIVDLASELGLSVATVSRALNHVPTVDEALAEQVLRHAERRGYVANGLARSLRSRTRTFVGFLVPDVENLAYSIAADACAQYVSKRGYQMILAISGDDPTAEHAALRSLAEVQVGGLIVAPSPGLTEESRALLAGRAVVQFNRDAGLSAHVVACDDRTAFADATRHLLELGHVELGYIGTADEVSNGRERLAGVRDELDRSRGRLPDERVMLLPPTERDGYLAARSMLSGERLPTALLVGGSNLSMGVARAVREASLGVPEDMSLVVYGDDRWGTLYEPALTTITVPYRDMAQAVVDILAGLVGGEPRPAAATTCLPARLVVRRSTAPVPSRIG